ncbi:hypothetical protein [Tritonibacter horizontis]|uniref:hypothetical protein n=1 Tax=Tritonibacter horizontis TaxID=1768241 RepID=UPI002FC2F003
MDQAGDSIANIAARVNQISESISGIANGAAEQSTGIGEINIAVAQLDQMTQQNAAMVEETTAAGQVLDDEARQLGSLVARFTFQSEAPPMQVRDVA